MLKDDITDKRKERHHKTQEDFTPVEICKILFEGQDELFSNFKKTFCDPCCGNGNIIRYLLRERLNNCKKSTDVYRALETIYGTELMQDNVQECKERILDLLDKLQIKYDKELALQIMDRNLICHDFFTWNFEEWREYTDEELKKLKIKTKEL